MKEYERPLVTVIDFTAEDILDDVVNPDGDPSTGENVEGGW